MVKSLAGRLAVALETSWYETEWKAKMLTLGWPWGKGNRGWVVHYFIEMHSILSSTGCPPNSQANST